jgi:1,4-alpha-glucan branching enzyme
MVGDDEQRFAGLRLLLAYQWAQPGKKLLFAGGELAPWQEWSHEHALPVEALAHPAHAGVFHLVQDLNRCYRTLPALHQWDCEDAGFEWVDAEDAASGIIAFLRQGSDRQPVLVVANFTPVARTNRRVGVPVPGRWREILNTDASHYGGRGVGNFGGLDTSPAPMHGRMQSLMLTVPPLGLLLLQPE